MENYKEITERLEYEELNSQPCSVHFYMDLFAHYLIQNMLTEANMLWIRIPINIKAENEELHKLHILMQSLRSNNYGTFFKEIDYNWSKNIKPIMLHLLQNVLNSVFTLIGNVYTSINETNLIKIFNMPKEQLEETYNALGWKADHSDQEIIIYPSRPNNNDNIITSSEYQLSKLTEIVSFLEN